MFLMHDDTSWSYAQISLLWELARGHRPLLEISSRLGKNYEEVYKKAAELGSFLVAEPTGQMAIIPAHAQSGNQPLGKSSRQVNNE